MIDAVILCGGLGTRLRSVIGEHAKVMAQVNGRPFLDRIMDQLRGQGARRVILCTGYQAQEIEAYYQANPGMAVLFSRETTPLGTGGALQLASGLIASDDFFVFNGDSFCPADLDALLSFHRQKNSLGTLAVSRVDNGADFGAVIFDAAQRILAFHEKSAFAPAGPVFANAGIYCFSKKIFVLTPQREKFSLEYDLFPQLVAQGLYAFVTESSFHDIGTPERIARARGEGNR
ncbi:MAG: nucleotidyltransferase family protein [Candidatus Omnitrophica bacterium]|nr:nucleotidyltransferase family protein [Candidatus Omnitrophota bacterium]